MQRSSVRRLPDVIEAASDEEAGEGAVEAEVALAIQIGERGAPESAGRLPAELRAAPPQRPDIERAV